MNINQGEPFLKSSGQKYELKSPIVRNHQDGVQFDNYDEKEEESCMNEIILANQNKLMMYLVAPLLSLCTGFIFALFIFWYQSLRVKLFYRKNVKLDDATHVIITGREGNVDIKPLYSSNMARPESKLTFEYRFI